MTDPRKCILIIEDDEDGRTILFDFFTYKGYEPIAVPDGRQALAVLTETLPAAIILDLRMPHVDGWTFAKLRRKRPALVQVPLVVVTASEPELVGGLNVDAIFFKPYVPSEVFAKVEELLLQRRAAAG